MASADEPAKFLFDTGEPAWRGERIALPPGFAADMGWVGEEDIRFAPGMFRAEADDFFSYVLVFLLEPGSDVSEAGIARELLTYYRGLAKAVMGGKQLEVDTSTFGLELARDEDPVEPLPEGIDAGDVTSYHGALDWIEPFATQEAQRLHLEVHAWSHGERPALFLCVSPKARDGEGGGAGNEALWETLRKVRATFRIEG